MFAGILGNRRLMDITEAMKQYDIDNLSVTYSIITNLNDRCGQHLPNDLQFPRFIDDCLSVNTMSAGLQGLGGHILKALFILA